MFAQAESEGRLPADRIEAVLSAILYAVKALGAAKGIRWTIPTEREMRDFYDPNVRPVYMKPFTDEELRKIEEAEEERKIASQRSGFALFKSLIDKSESLKKAE